MRLLYNQAQIMTRSSPELPNEPDWYSLALQEVTQIDLFHGREDEIAREIQEIIISKKNEEAPKDIESYVLQFGSKKLKLHFLHVYAENKLVQINSGSRIERVQEKEKILNDTTIIYLAVKIIMQILANNHHVNVKFSFNPIKPETLAWAKGKGQLLFGWQAQGPYYVIIQPE